LIIYTQTAYNAAALVTEARPTEEREERRDSTLGRIHTKVFKSDNTSLHGIAIES